MSFDVWYTVTNFLPLKDIYSLSKTCKEFSNLKQYVKKIQKLKHKKAHMLSKIFDSKLVLKNNRITFEHIMRNEIFTFQLGTMTDKLVVTCTCVNGFDLGYTTCSSSILQLEKLVNNIELATNQKFVFDIHTLKLSPDCRFWKLNTRAQINPGFLYTNANYITSKYVSLEFLAVVNFDIHYNTLYLVARDILFVV
jgi:hypothetical protein